MIYYLTKYCLSDGKIHAFEDDPSRSDEKYIRRKGDAFGMFVLGRDCFVSRDEALADAEKRRDAKIASLKKQLAKLEVRTFSVS